MMILINILENIGNLIQSIVDVSSKMCDVWVDMSNSGISENIFRKNQLETFFSNWT